MKNALCEQLGIDYPLFAFTHCRDVVVHHLSHFGIMVYTYG